MKARLRIEVTRVASWCPHAPRRVVAKDLKQGRGFGATIDANLAVWAGEDLEFARLADITLQRNRNSVCRASSTAEEINAAGQSAEARSRAESCWLTPAIPQQGPSGPGMVMSSGSRRTGSGGLCRSPIRQGRVAGRGRCESIRHKQAAVTRVPAGRTSHGATPPGQRRRSTCIAPKTTRPKLAAKFAGAS